MRGIDRPIRRKPLKRPLRADFSSGEAEKTGVKAGDLLIWQFFEARGPELAKIQHVDGAYCRLEAVKYRAGPKFRWIPTRSAIKLAAEYREANR